MSRSCRRRSNSESGLRRLGLMSQPPPHLKRPGVEGGTGRVGTVWPTWRAAMRQGKPADSREEPEDEKARRNAAHSMWRRHTKKTVHRPWKCNVADVAKQRGIFPK